MVITVIFFITNFSALHKSLYGGTEERSKKNLAGSTGIKLDFLTFLDAAIWP